jgi:dihydroorotase
MRAVSDEPIDPPAGGRVIDPSQSQDGIADVLIVGDRIEAIGPRVAGDTADRDGLETIDCTGFVVSPGFIDVHCHLREPGREEVETIATGARAAAPADSRRCAPCRTPIRSPTTKRPVGFISRQASVANAARVYPIGAISVGQRGDALAEIGEMVAAGAVAVSDDGKPVVSAHLMRTALEYARTFGIPVADHCEEPTLAKGGAMNEGLVSARLGLKGIPAEAEEIMAIRDILLARLTGGHIHLCHMSTRGSVELIRWGKDRGINVTAEVCPHHISLTENAVEGYDTNAKMNPPLRTADDVAALQEAVRDGTIDLIATDHAPHHYDEKEREFADAPNGIIGLETALAVNITWLVAPGIIDVPLSSSACRVRRRGFFTSPGARFGEVRPPTSRCSIRGELARRAVAVQVERPNTPYSGQTLQGRAQRTIVGGRTVHIDGT